MQKQNHFSFFLKAVSAFLEGPFHIGTCSRGKLVNLCSPQKVFIGGI